MLTLDDYFKGQKPTLPEHIDNATELLRRMNLLVTKFYADHPGAASLSFRELASGYRTEAVNAVTAGAAAHSKHMSGQAGDLGDGMGARAYRRWLVINEPLLKQIGLWVEDPRATPTWGHTQCVPPASQARYFIPNSAWATRVGGKPLSVDDI